MENTKKRDLKYFGDLAIDNAIYLVLGALLLIIIIKEPGFVDIGNFKNIITQASSRIIMALGVGAIIISKGTDLSLGRQVGLTAVISASLLQSGDYAYKMYPNLAEFRGAAILLPILLVVVVGMVFSFINGFVVAKLSVDPFIATLGMMIIVYGVTSLYYDRPPYGAQPIGGFSKGFTKFAQGSFLAIPNLIWYAAVVIILMWILLNKTKFGKNLYAIGGNSEAAFVSGVNVAFYTILVYVIAGALYGFGGALEAGRIGTATNNTGNMYELDAISACIVGGLSFDGGIGTVQGIVTGVLIFQVIAYGLSYVSVPIYWQYIIKGLIIIIAVAIDSRKHKRKK